MRCALGRENVRELRFDVVVEEAVTNFVARAKVGLNSFEVVNTEEPSDLMRVRG